MYTEGVGLKDFEEHEQIFVKSNKLASVMLLASPYHQVRHIYKHFMFYDQDKHAASGAFSVEVLCIYIQHPQSGNFIFQNYCQALDKIESESQQFAALAAWLKTMDADYESYIKAEHDHLLIQFKYG